MTRRSKALDKLAATPPPANFKWADLVSVLGYLGFEMITNSGSRRKFFHREKDVLIICHQPHPSPNVNKGCIAAVVEALRNNGFLQS